MRLHPLPAVTEYRAYLFRDFASGTATLRACLQHELPVAMLRLSDVDETHFQRAFARAGSATAHPRPAIVAAPRGCAAIEKGLRAHRAVRRLARRGDLRRGSASRRLREQHGAMTLGEAPAARWREGRFHAPYLRDPMLDRGLGVDTLETATSWSRLPTLYSAVKAALEIRDCRAPCRVPARMAS